ncbi:cache domain-containing protein [Vibrio mediterranei]|nr:cache domain-containing protein [Vibrio mediterranei]
MRIRCNDIYKDSEYVYIADEDRTFIVVPLDPVLLHYGTSFHNFKDGVGQSVTDIILSELGNTTSMAVAYNWTQKLPSVDTEYKLSIAERTPFLMFDPCCSYRFFVTAITKEDFSYSWRRPTRGIACGAKSS